MLHFGPVPGTRRRLWLFASTLLLVLLAACGMSGSSAGSARPSAPPRVELRPIEGGPTVLRSDITLRKLVDIGANAVKLVHNPADNALYVLHVKDGLKRVDLGAGGVESVATVAEMVDDAVPSGLTIGPDGTLYVVANRRASDTETQGLVVRGAPSDGGWSWSTLASSAPYQLGGTNFDHLFNGIAVSPDNQWVYVASGSRTDHGEVESNNAAFPDAREIALTARIFRLPAGADDLVLPNDENKLADAGLVYARGTRNAYDMAFAPNGDLLAVDNGPDADYPDELNWIREGAHYGFPWRFGVQDNPQQFPDYDDKEDKRLNPDFVAVQRETYGNDPGFPQAPGALTDPVANLGPDGNQTRADDGSVLEVPAGDSLATFTPHRSPLGLVFITDERMPADLRSDDTTFGAFVLSWGSAGGTLSDRGEDLLHLALRKQGANYQSVTTQVARDFHNPIDAVVVENRLYVLDYGADGTIWELAFAQAEG